jgi:hypothetical protein
VKNERGYIELPCKELLTKCPAGLTWADLKNLERGGRGERTVQGMVLLMKRIIVSTVSGG